MATLEVIATTHALLGGQAADASYATVHNQANAGYIFTDNFLSMGQQYYEVGAVAYYEIHRCGFIFDTSSLPDNAIISAVVLSLYGSSKDDDATFDITVVDGADLDDPIVVADYGQLLNDTTSLGTINSASWSLIGFNEITLNAIGRALINKAGNTKLAIRSSRDISSTAPTPSDPWNEYVECFAIDEASKEPKLTITYSPFIPHAIII